MERDNTINMVIQRLQGVKAARDLMEMYEGQKEESHAIEVEELLLSDALTLLQEEAKRVGAEVH